MNKPKNFLTKELINSLENNWTAEVKLNNGKIITIWHTAWPSSKNTISEILSISSDYPRVKKNLAQ